MKAKSKKSVGFLDDPVNWIKKKASDFIDEGSALDKLKNRKKYQDEALKQADQ